MIIAHHIILTGYGHWLPNDPRGSLSRGLRNEAFREFGDIHYGRKDRQPSREQLKAFHDAAGEVLQFPILWFEAEHRRRIGLGIGEAIVDEQLTCYACAVLPDHVHLLMRVHRLKAQEILPILVTRTRDCLRDAGLVPPDHPVWSRDENIRYKDTPRAVHTTIAYALRNLVKHRIEAQDWNFVTPYNDWPLHNKR